MKTSVIAGFVAAFVGIAGAGAALIMGGEQARDPSVVRQGAAQVAAPVTAAPQAAKVPAVADTGGVKSADSGFVIKRILPIKGPIRYGEWHWDDAGVAPGPLVVTVDLEARVLSVFRGGYEIGATAVLLGTQEKPTPTGVFPITQKRVDHVSNLYDAPMPYMQRLTDDGITLHATNVQNGYASHGCIGMPLAFAKKLFGVTAIGDRVFITRGKQVGLGDQIAS